MASSHSFSSTLTSPSSYRSNRHSSLSHLFNPSSSSSSNHTSLSSPLSQLAQQNKAEGGSADIILRPNTQFGASLRPNFSSSHAAQDNQNQEPATSTRDFSAYNHNHRSNSLSFSTGSRLTPLNRYSPSARSSYSRSPSYNQQPENQELFSSFRTGRDEAAGGYRNGSLKNGRVNKEFEGVRPYFREERAGEENRPSFAGRASAQNGRPSSRDETPSRESNSPSAAADAPHERIQNSLKSLAHVPTEEFSNPPPPEKPSSRAKTIDLNSLRERKDAFNEEFPSLDGSSKTDDASKEQSTRTWSKLQPESKALFKRGSIELKSFTGVVKGPIERVPRREVAGIPVIGNKRSLVIHAPSSKASSNGYGHAANNTPPAVSSRGQNGTTENNPYFQYESIYGYSYNDHSFDVAKDSKTCQDSEKREDSSKFEVDASVSLEQENKEEIEPPVVEKQPETEGKTEKQKAEEIKAVNGLTIPVVNKLKEGDTDQDLMNFPLSRSFTEAEERLLREMGWSEPSEDENFAPLTDEELREAKDLIEKSKLKATQESNKLKPVPAKMFSLCNGNNSNGNIGAANGVSRFSLFNGRRDNGLHIPSIFDKYLNILPEEGRDSSSSSDESDDDDC